MITEEEIEKCLDFKRDSATPIAQAMHDRVQLENFRKSKLALLFLRLPKNLKSGRRNNGPTPMKITKR